MNLTHRAFTFFLLVGLFTSMTTACGSKSDSSSSAAPGPAKKAPEPAKAPAPSEPVSAPSEPAKIPPASPPTSPQAPQATPPPTSPPTPPTPPTPPKKPLEVVRKIEAGKAPAKVNLKIVDASLVGKLVADYTDNPPAYAVRGKPQPLSDTTKFIHNDNATACYVRLNKFKLRSGEVLKLTGINVDGVKNQKDLFFATFYHSQIGTQNGLFIVCLTKNSAVTYEGVKEALAGMIELSR